MNILLSVKLNYPMLKVKIVIAENHIPYRKALMALLKRDKRFEIIAETEDGDSTVYLATQLRPDIVLMDVKLEGKNGIDATREIKDLIPEIKIIALSHSDHRGHQIKMLSFGASAYLTKKSTIEEIKSTILKISGINFTTPLY